MATKTTKPSNTSKSSTSPAKAPAVKPIRDGMHTVAPHLVCTDAVRAIDFYQKAFGAKEIFRLVAPNGSLIHGSVSIGDSVVMLCEEFPACGNVSPKTLKGTPVTIHLSVENVDELVAKAVKAGATLKMPVADMFWGDRYGIVEDPFGHQWSIATHIRDVSHEEMQQAATCMSGEA